LILCCPTDIVKGIKLRRTRWAEHTARTHTQRRENRNEHRVLMETLKCNR